MEGESMATTTMEGRAMMRSIDRPTPWRAVVTTHPVAGALIAGFVATHIATVTGYWYHGIGLVDLGWPDFNGNLLLGVKASALSRFWAGATFHFATGMCFSLIFAFVIHPMLPIKNSTGGNILKGILFGMVLATISAIWWVPQLFNSVFGADLGWFSQNVGPLFYKQAGWTVPFGIYLWHFVYGFNLGALYNPLPAELGSM
jgi:hypothetical protein